jgi:WD40 repeat protein
VAFLAEEAGRRLRREGTGHLELLWRASADSPALDRILVGHDSEVTTVAVTAGGRGLVSGGLDGTMRTWDLSSGRQSLLIRAHTYGVRKVLASPEGRWAVSHSSDGTAAIWDLEGPRQLISLENVAWGRQRGT